VNDEFLTSDNRKVVLERIVDEDRSVTVYNLEVEADHTYFVGGQGWGFDVWSHNHNNAAGETGLFASEAYPVIQQNTPEWRQAVKKIRDMEEGDKVNVRVETAQDASLLLQEGRGNMNRYHNYTRDGDGPHRNYKKGYEAHNHINEREMMAQNDLPHLKWHDNGSGGHIFYDKPN
jgi:hypothetical protein